MLFDTDILIWIQRGNKKAVGLAEKTDVRCISLQTYMELFQCAENKLQQKRTKDFLTDFGFTVLPLTEKIGHRAAVYIEEYSLKTGLRAGDALIAATAVENNLSLSTSNGKHFRDIQDIDLRVFNP